MASKSTFNKLIKAVQGGDEVECARVLGLKTADINKKCVTFGISAILEACNGGHVSVVALLLSKGANINDKDNNGWSSIMLASREGRECCRVVSI